MTEASSPVGTSSTRKVIAFRANQVEREQIEQAAAAAGLPVATWVREAALEQVPTMPAEDRHALREVHFGLRFLEGELAHLLQLARDGSLDADPTFVGELKEVYRRVREARKELGAVLQ